MEASPSPVYGARLLSGFGLIPIASSNLAASATVRVPQPLGWVPSRRGPLWVALDHLASIVETAPQPSTGSKWVSPLGRCKPGS